MIKKNNDGKEKEKFVNIKNSEISSSKKIQHVNLDDLLFPFDLNSLYSSIFSLMDSINPIIKTSFVFIEDMND